MNIKYALLALLISSSTTVSANTKVDVCHFANNKTLNISISALESHLSHGDYQGQCDNSSDSSASSDSSDSSADSSGTRTGWIELNPTLGSPSHRPSIKVCSKGTTFGYVIKVRPSGSQTSTRVECP